MSTTQAGQIGFERDLEAHAEPTGVLSGELVRAPTRWEHFRTLVRQSLLLKVGLLLVAIALFLTVFGPLIAPHPTTTASGDVNLPPGGDHWFGTDASGFDVFSRVIAAARVDVTIAVVATIVSVALGSLVGLLASFFRGWAGELVMRASDTVQAFPLFVLAVVFVVLAGRSYVNIIIVIALLNVPIYLRLIRSEVLSLRERTFVEAARANGDRPLSIALRHVLPNAMTPGFAQAPITLGFAIIIIAGLSFIGAGVQPPTPEWGAMINAGKDDIILGGWWTSVFPGAAMSLTVFGFAVVGEAVQAVVMRRT
jgi:peptide/nickel transport system permease protein